MRITICRDDGTVFAMHNDIGPNTAAWLKCYLLGEPFPENEGVGELEASDIEQDLRIALTSVVEGTMEGDNDSNI